MVGVRGFEPPTSSSRTKRATGLRYTPTEGPIGYRAYVRGVNLDGLKLFYGWTVSIGKGVSRVLCSGRCQQLFEGEIRDG